MTSSEPRLGRIGVWSLELRFGDRGEAADAAAELDELGYAALWVPGGVGGDITGDLDRLLGATRRMTIATGILNIWKHEPAEIAAWWKSLPGAERERVLLGLGVSHAHVVGEAYVKPLSVMRDQSYPNYQNSWLRLGFSDEEIASASDRLVDALFSWGDAGRIAERVNAHFAAGADHVCIQAITGAGLAIKPARAAWRELASSLL